MANEARILILDGLAAHGYGIAFFAKITLLKYYPVAFLILRLTKISPIKDIEIIYTNKQCVYTPGLDVQYSYCMHSSRVCTHTLEYPIPRYSGLGDYCSVPVRYTRVLECTPGRSPGYRLYTSRPGTRVSCTRKYSCISVYISVYTAVP